MSLAGRQQLQNTARPRKTKYSGLPRSLEKMRTKVPSASVQVRAPQMEGSRPGEQRSPSVARGAPGDSSQASLQPWEERRQQDETLVNRCLLVDASGGEPGSGSGAVCYSFDARQKFQQVLSKQDRVSDEQRFLAGERRSAAAAGTIAVGGGTVTGGAANRGLAATREPNGGSAPACHRSRSRSAGAFTQTAPGSVRLDGEHIDHTKIAPLREDPKLSRMSEEERGRQFSTYFSNALKDSLKMKCEVCADLAGKNMEKFQEWRVQEFRPDQPQRHGKFGRRVFDPQVKEMPLSNPLGVSEIDSMPQEEFQRQQERLHDFLDRSLPAGQQRHFEQYMPASEQPPRHVEMVNRVAVRSVMDGEQKNPMWGWGQNRHSDHTDFKLYSRPLGTSQIDRLVPIS